MENEKRITCTGSFAASHPVNGGFYTLRYSDGKVGGVNIRNSHTFILLHANLSPIEGEKPRISMDDAILDLHDILSKEDSDK